MSRLFGLLAMLCCAAFVGWGVVRTVNYIVFDRNAEGYLKRAADANTVELASNNLAVAVDYLKKNGLTSGYTSVLWRTPDEDVGFWFSNLETALGELRATRPDAQPLEKSNVLMKLRETLLDEGKDGTFVTSPEGISVFPNNSLYFWWGWGSPVLAALFFMFGCAADAASRSSRRYS